MNSINDILSRRRAMLGGAAVLAAGTVMFEPSNSQAQSAPEPAGGQPQSGFTPVTTPNGSTLPYKTVGGAKVFHLIAEPVRHEFAPGLVCQCWGYNGSTPGPTIEAVRGDRVRIYVTNRLAAPTTVHWHGMPVPCGMDGVNGLTQKPIPPGQTFKYEFTLKAAGTYMYHPHFDEMTQQGLGMMGMFIVHPGDSAEQGRTRVDRDFALLLSEWRVDPGASRPNPIEMVEFNIFTMNSRAYPATAPMVVKKGERVRIRFGNLSAMDHHPIHLHGYQFRITEIDAGRVPEAGQYRGNTVLVPVGSTRAVEFVADVEGDWAMHCHMSHHTMNQMGHRAPNMLGVNPKGLDGQISPLLPGYMTMGETGMGEMSDMHMPGPKNSIPMLGGTGAFGSIDMGGMFNVLKVREGIIGYDDPGNYRFPAGSVSDVASAEDLRRDGIAM